MPVNVEFVNEAGRLVTVEFGHEFVVGQLESFASMVGMLAELQGRGNYIASKNFA